MLEVIFRPFHTEISQFSCHLWHLGSSVASDSVPVYSTAVQYICDGGRWGGCVLNLSSWSSGIVTFGVKWWDFWLAKGWMTSHDLKSGPYWDIYKTRYLLPCCCLACQTLWSMLTMFVFPSKQICTYSNLYTVLKQSPKLKYVFLECWFKRRRRRKKNNEPNLKKYICIHTAYFQTNQTQLQ